MARRGRSNAAMLARMGRILLLLRAHPAGLTTEDLLTRVGYGEAPRTSRIRTLNRDLVALARDGWRIDTLATANTPAVRVLRTVDPRFATLFTPAQRTQLARAALCAGPEVAAALSDDLGHDPGPPAFVMAPADGLGRLSVCQAAAADRCRLRFTYKGTRRTVHPFAIVLRPHGWYLRALDEGDGVVKMFAVDRIRALSEDAPGTAQPAPPSVPEPTWDFMRQQVHDPIDVTVLTSQDHLPEVLSALATHGYDLLEGEDPGQLVVRVRVTSTRAAVDRILELGTRVRLLGPPPVRDALRERLTLLAGPR